MIYIGLDASQKREKILQALQEYEDTDRIFVFYGDKEAPAMDFDGIETIYIPYPETEMYRTFYPLLGQPYKDRSPLLKEADKRTSLPAITNKSLLVVDEFLVTKARVSLKYNCTGHFMRISERRLVFNYFPVIDNLNDFMILADKAHPDIYKDCSFSAGIVPDIAGLRRLPEISCMAVEITDEDKERYAKKKASIDDEMKNSSKDPNIFPRMLALYAGGMKKKAVNPDAVYLARNNRLKLSNVYTPATIPSAKRIYLVDMPYRLKDFELMLRKTEAEEIVFLHTGLPVDEVYWNILKEWKNTVEDFYEAADIRE